MRLRRGGLYPALKGGQDAGIRLTGSIARDAHSVTVDQKTDLMVARGRDGLYSPRMRALMSSPEILPLLPHPLTAWSGPHVRVGATFMRDQSGLRITYRIAEGLASLVLAGTDEVIPEDRLWQRTCVEAFVSGAGERYSEFNFSPNGQWAWHKFDAYRQRTRLSAGRGAPIVTAIRREPSELVLEANVPARCLDEAGVDVVALGLSAVLEGTDGQLSYYALAHTGPTPDFHDRRTWQCNLGPASLRRGSV